MEPVYTIHTLTRARFVVIGRHFFCNDFLERAVRVCACAANSLDKLSVSCWLVRGLVASAVSKPVYMMRRFAALLLLPILVAATQLSPVSGKCVVELISI